MRAARGLAAVVSGTIGPIATLSTVSAPRIGRAARPSRPWSRAMRAALDLEGGERLPARAAVARSLQIGTPYIPDAFDRCLSVGERPAAEQQQREAQTTAAGMT